MPWGSHGYGEVELVKSNDKSRSSCENEKKNMLAAAGRVGGGVAPPVVDCGFDGL